MTSKECRWLARQMLTEGSRAAWNLASGARSRRSRREERRTGSLRPVISWPSSSPAALQTRVRTIALSRTSPTARERIWATQEWTPAPTQDECVAAAVIARPLRVA
jgi:hypothetical protein